MIFDTTSPSNNITLPMCLNLVEDHAKCLGNLVTQDSQASKCLHEPMPPYFLSIYHLYDPFKCEYGKQVLLGPISPYYKIYVSISTYGTSRFVKHYLKKSYLEII